MYCFQEIQTVIAKNAQRGNVGTGEKYGQAGLAYDESKLMYDMQKSASQPYGLMALPSNMIPRRSKVFLNNNVVPVYQSNYMGPAFVRS